MVYQRRLILPSLIVHIRRHLHSPKKRTNERWSHADHTTTRVVDSDTAIIERDRVNWEKYGHIYRSEKLSWFLVNYNKLYYKDQRGCNISRILGPTRRWNNDIWLPHESWWFRYFVKLNSVPHKVTQHTGRREIVCEGFLYKKIIEEVLLWSKGWRSLEKFIDRDMRISRN